MYSSGFTAESRNKVGIISEKGDHGRGNLVKKWDGNSSLVVFCYAVTGSIFHDSCFPWNSLKANSRMSAYQKRKFSSILVSVYLEKVRVQANINRSLN